MRLEVRTALGDQVLVRAEHVVLATGVPIADRGGFLARLQPQRSYAAALRSPWVAPGMYLSSDPVRRSIWSAPTEEGELLLVGGNGHVTGRHDLPPQRGLAELVGWARARFPQSHCLHTWSAQDHLSVSGLPYVGRLTPRSDRATVATGHRKGG